MTGGPVKTKTKLFLTVAATMVASHAYAQQVVETEAYTELTQAQILRVVGEGKTLKNIAKVEAGTIIAVDAKKLNAAIELQRLNPSEVNYSFENEKGEVQVSRNGFVCGVQLIDVPDEDQRESDLMDRQDLCIALNVLQKQVSVMDGNAAQVKAALNEFQTDNRSTLLASLAEQSQDSQFAESAGDEMLNPVMEYVAGAGGFVKPLPGSLYQTSGFGLRKHPVLKRRRLHKGMDLRARVGTPVMSTLPGRVLALKTERNRRTKRISGYGHYVIVIHPQKGMRTLYAHLSSFRSTVGQSVAAGERIALSGATGLGSGPHLHFETHVGSRAVNPKTFLQSLFGSLQQMVEKFFVIG